MASLDVVHLGFVSSFALSPSIPPLPLSPPPPPAWPPLGALHVDATRRSWADAQSHCVLHGARLVSIYSAEQNAAVFAAVGAVGDRGREVVWLGGSDQATDGEWTWTEGVVFSNGPTAVNGAYVNWCATTHRPQLPT